MVCRCWRACGNQAPDGDVRPVSGAQQVGIIQGKPGLPGTQPVRPGDPFNADYPPFIKISFGDELNYQGGSDFALTVYRIDEIDRAPYPTIRPIIEKLRKLLAARRESDLDRLEVPIYPIWNAGELIQAKTQYFDADWGSGIFFVTSFSNGVAEYPDNSTLTYLFAGLSKDGKFFISADFKVTHPKLSSPDYRPHLSHASGPLDSPARQADQKAADDATAKAQAFLPRQPDNSFRPPLRKLRNWISTLTFREPSG